MYLMKLTSFYFQIVLGFAVYTFALNPKTTGDICTTNGDICLKLKDCPYFNYEDIKKGSFQPPLCGFNNSEPIVCCTRDFHAMFGFGRRTKSAEKCAQYNHEICGSRTNKTVGVAKRITELPFMALIGYGPYNNVSWSCAGSLISTRYILSSALCTNTEDTNSARWVKLGQFNNPEKLQQDKGRTQVLSIVSSINHPEYRHLSLYNDISLHLLNKEVIFNDYIRPICLHQYISVLTHRHVISTGWTELRFQYPPIITELDIMPYTTCNKSRSRQQLPNGFDTRAMLCIGSERVIDTPCPNTYGAPIILPSTNTNHNELCSLRIQVGVTSSPFQCNNVKRPGIYTNVANYISWIESIVWPDDTDAGGLFIWMK